MPKIPLATSHVESIEHRTEACLQNAQCFAGWLCCTGTPDTSGASSPLRPDGTALFGCLQAFPYRLACMSGCSARLEKQRKGQNVLCVYQNSTTAARRPGRRGSTADRVPGFLCMNLRMSLFPGVPFTQFGHRVTWDVYWLSCI